MRLVLLVFMLISTWVHAEIPDDYQPLVVKPPFSFTERIFDLTPAFEKAARLDRPLLIYLGAADCPPCKDYTAFLRTHQDEMKPLLAGLVLVDLRTWLKGGRIVFQIKDLRYSVDEFKSLVGDTNKGLFYPTWWLLTPQGQQIRQLPRGSENYTTVQSHRKLVALPVK